MKPNYKLVPVYEEMRISEVLKIFQSNPGYFNLTKGAEPDRNDVLEALIEMPEDVPAENKHTMLIRSHSGQRDDPVAVADWLEDYPEEGTCYLGLFITSATIQGTGESRQILEWLLEGFQHGGMSIVRLGVVKENQRARRFWARAGFREVRRVIHHKDVLTHEVIIMDRDLTAQAFQDSLAGCQAVFD